MKERDRISQTMPIQQMLEAYEGSNPLPFHMPGHLLGRGLIEEFKSIGRLDITEIPGSDCLHHPEGVIKEAQEYAAHLFGADYTLFLVNGSTSGIHAMIQATVNPGGKLIVGRDCHQSVLNALALIHAEPLFILPEMDVDNQIPLGIKGDALRQVLSSHPDAQGILITRPNYYGVATPLDEIVKLARCHSIPLLIDEAHGAHFKFHKRLPATALEKGADLCVQSLHKTLPALTQTALLHGNKNSRVDRLRVERVVSMVQTTSPSYLLMTSIDSARQMMEEQGCGLYEILWLNIMEFDRRLNEISHIKRVARGYKGYETDFSRIVLSFKQTRLSGFQAEELLRTRYGIVAEMADMEHVVLIATPFHTTEDFGRLLKALKEMVEEYKVMKHEKRQVVSWPVILPDRVMPLREALFYARRELPIKEALGEISAVPIVPYPPGIPLINPGERITASCIDFIEVLLNEKYPIHGVNQGKLQVVDLK